MYSTTFSLNHYCRRVEGGQSGITQRRTLGLRERMRYDFLVRLFGGELRHETIERRYGKAFYLLLGPELAAMRALGATRHDSDAIRLTRRGMYCWILMMAEFFNAVNDVREQMREHIRAELDAWNEEARIPLSAITRNAR
jgi:coproporphyrinogen III oxidase-like Fe-S oxidoreductase